MPLTVDTAVRADEAIVARLSTDATLAGLVSGIYSGLFPDRLPPPYVRIDDMEDGDNVMVVGLAKIMTHLNFLVRGYTLGPDWGTAREISDRIDAVLHAADWTEGGLNFVAYQTAPFKDTESASGKLYRVAGGFYHVLVTS